MKRITFFVIAVSIILTSCNNPISDPLPSSMTTPTLKPMETISNHYLDLAIDRLGIVSSGSKELSKSDMSIKEKADLITSFLTSSKANGTSSKGIETQDTIIQQICEEMARDITAISVQLNFKDGTKLDLTDKNSAFFNGADFSKAALIALVDQNNVGSSTKGIWKIGDLKWPSGTVYYRFTDGMTEERKQIVRMAMMSWASATGRVGFSEIENSAINELLWSTMLNWHVKISDKSDINAAGQSTVGYGPYRFIDLASYSQRTILHELGHTMGLWHEHQRYDRDNYIDINWPNIVGDDFLNPRRTTNFGLIDKDNVLGFVLVIDINLVFFHYHWEGYIELARWENSRVTAGYDYLSVMGYPSFFGNLTVDSSVWAIRRKTVGPDQYNLGGDTLTPGDVQAIQSVY